MWASAVSLVLHFELSELNRCAALPCEKYGAAITCMLYAVNRRGGLEHALPLGVDFGIQAAYVEGYVADTSTRHTTLMRVWYFVGRWQRDAGCFRRFQEHFQGLSCYAWYGVHTDGYGQRASKAVACALVPYHDCVRKA